MTATATFVRVVDEEDTTFTIYTLSEPLRLQPDPVESVLAELLGLASPEGEQVDAVAVSTRPEALDDEEGIPGTLVFGVEYDDAWDTYRPAGFPAQEISSPDKIDHDELLRSAGYVVVREVTE